MRKRKIVTPVLLVVFALLLLGDWPLQLALQGKWATPFYVGEKLPDHYLKGSLKQLEQRVLDADQAIHWKNFSIAQYLFPFPYQHPDYGISFRLDIGEEAETFIGVNFFNPEGRHLLSFKLIEVKALKELLQKQLIFTLPTAKKLIRQWTLPEIWAGLICRRHIYSTFLPLGSSNAFKEILPSANTLPALSFRW